MRIALVAFKRTVASEVAQSIGFDTYEVGSTKRLIAKFIESEALNDYDCIVALGLKNNSKDSYVHVESVCYGVAGRVISLQTALADNVNFKVTRMPRNLTGSFCNILASGLAQKYKAKKVSFLHVPPKIDVSVVTDDLRERLSVVYGQDTRP